jgi:predicted nucleic acid-binding protein
MTIYWDSSALIEAVYSPDLMRRLLHDGGTTRPHSLAETFSVLTGNPVSRIDADDAARVVKHLAANLTFVEISADETLRALQQARKKGVRGGRIHDFLHAAAAEKAGADRILTLDRQDFSELTDVEIEII